ncbi:MAG: hypothetical protein ACD_4C00337G0007 [uncultured bacterium (gcode 4)]|uniref:Uncharacterized protein n=1 Tax=uncultured bacterium (gcode 4) TaxID=1234023 RepID=K2G886_9BACT|nr:MAG: hypothetical protein ACD_4C00337G0007 [uncultured bacterium (gcode 4)]
MIQNKKWYTVVELMVGILIFTIWFLSAYLLVYSAINSSTKSKNEIIASNIAREQIELVKNIRDTNWLRNNNFDNLSDFSGSWYLGDYKYYIIENDYNIDSPIKIKNLNSSFNWTKNDVLNSSELRLCIDDMWRYIHPNNPSDCHKRTTFYSFLKVDKLITKNTITNMPIIVTWAYRIESIVINTEKWYNEFNINTIITDWKK